MGNIIKYHNDMNKVSFSNFKEKELDLFFSICQQMKEKGEQEINFSFPELRKLSNYSNRSIERLYEDLDKVYKKMLELNLKVEDENYIKRFVLFNMYTIDKKRQLVTIKANENFLYILNNLIGNFTKFELLEFTSLKSVYSKNTFKLLKQWESIKNKEIEINELYNLLGVPESYKFCDFNKRVLKPIQEELPSHFPNLNIEKIKTGKKITSIKFMWGIKAKELKHNEVIEISVSEELNKTIEKVKGNRYITPYLTIDNVELLLKIYKEKDLIKGLKHAYKAITKDFISFNYLIKVIETGIETKEKKIKVITEVEEKEKIITSEQLTIKTKVSQEEYENIYQEYLKANKVKHSKIIKTTWDNMNKDKFEFIEETQEKKGIIEFNEIDQVLLNSKTGKILVGNALIMKLKKISKDIGKTIKYKNEIIEG